MEKEIDRKASHPQDSTIEKKPKRKRPSLSDAAIGDLKVHTIWTIIALVAFFVLLGALVILFAYKQYLWDCSTTIDHEKFGAFGDISGGVLGTFVALIGVIYVYFAFKEQLKFNDMMLTATTEQQEQQQAQRFDSQFNSFLMLYNAAINEYSAGDEERLNGKDNIHKLAQEFLKKDFKIKTTYGKRVDSASALFEDFYLKHSEEMSTHFRMLYQLMRFISNADYIGEKTRVDYAKAVRGNLTEAEMIFLRYNCYCSFGRKMQQYVNEFNLLKHLPLMKLFEFRKWADLISDDNYAQALETMFINLRKDILTLITTINGEEWDQRTIKCGSYWMIQTSYSHSNNSLNVEITRRVPRTYDKAPSKTNVEQAFDKLGVDNLSGLFIDYFLELFFKSNFHQYNNGNNVKVELRKENTKEGDSQISFDMEFTYPPILSQRQISEPQRQKS